MTRTIRLLVSVASVLAVLFHHPGSDMHALASPAAADYKVVPDWLRLPQGRDQLGNMHGDVAVSSTGDVYVSVQDPQAGLQVYAPDGRFLRNVPDAPADLHGFVIRRQPDGEFIFGPTLRGQTIVKMTLEGKVVLTIPASAIPDEFKVRNARSGQLSVLLTGMDVAPNRDLYVTDGYASDYIHRFDKAGKYLNSFGGKKEPYNFSTLHKLAIDTRFQPARIIACDRANNRVVHLSLSGDLIGGQVVTRLGTNTEPGVGGNQLKPEQWRPGIVVSPHGVATNDRGDLFVSEFNIFGRIHRFNRQ